MATEVKEQLKIALAQMTSVDDVEINLKQMEDLLKEIFLKNQEQDSPRLVCFPENCLYMRLVEGEKIDGFLIHSPVFKKLQEWAITYKTHLHLGSIPLYIENHFYNSSVLITPDGEIQPSYQKMHLFDIQLEGHKPLQESDVFRHGQHPHLLEVDGFRIGESICYDVRFAELYAQYARQEVDLILVPAAFLVKTGQAHWQILLRARAIESQAYVLASAQSGTHESARGGKRETYGHSLAVDPWGEVLADLKKPGPAAVVLTLSKDKIAQVRRQIPMKFHRRLPVGS